MRRCFMCGQEKPLDAFPLRSRALGTRNHACQPCFTVYRRAHYRAHRAAYVERSVRNLRARRREWAKRVWRYLREHPCVDCGEADPVVLEFDHLDRARKLTDVNALVRKTVRWEVLTAEMEKCAVRCANCHRRRTACQFGWPKLEFGEP